MFPNQNILIIKLCWTSRNLLLIVCKEKWLRRRFAAQARTERVSRSLKREPMPAPVIAAAKRASRAVALIIVTY